MPMICVLQSAAIYYLKFKAVIVPLNELLRPCWADSTKGATTGVLK
jgi:hypothetical protein